MAFWASTGCVSSVKCWELDAGALVRLSVMSSGNPNKATIARVCIGFCRDGAVRVAMWCASREQKHRHKEIPRHHCFHCFGPPSEAGIPTGLGNSQKLEI
jgi:hypothetical protein